MQFWCHFSYNDTCYWLTCLIGRRVGVLHHDIGKHKAIAFLTLHLWASKSLFPIRRKDWEIPRSCHAICPCNENIWGRMKWNETLWMVQEIASFCRILYKLKVWVQFTKPKRSSLLKDISMNYSYITNLVILSVQLDDFCSHTKQTLPQSSVKLILQLHRILTGFLCTV